MSKKTLLIGINIVTLLLIVVGGVVFSQRLKSQLVENFTNEELNHEMAYAENIALTLRLEMESQVILFTQLAQLPEIQSSDSEVCNQKLDELFSTYGKKLINIGRMNAQGIFDCSRNRAAIGVNGTEAAPHLKTIINDPQHRAVLGRIIVSATDKSVVTSFHVPIFSKSGKFLGTLGGAINFADLKDKYLSEVAVLEQGYATINDDNGDILSHPRAEFAGKNIWSEEMQKATGRNAALNEMFKNMEAGKRGSGRYVFEDKEKMMAYAPAAVFPGRVWAVAITVPMEDVRKGILTETIGQTFFGFNIFLIVTILLVFIILQFFENQWLFKPLRLINAALKKLSEGDLTETAIAYTGSSTDEFGQLTENLKQAISAIRQKGVNVDKIIGDKTQELSKKVAELEKANQAMAGRELKMIELKKEIAELKKSK
ncbi:MAG: methyl-accepting chemotaxis protein [Patescibacteria group bacterium]